MSDYKRAPISGLAGKLLRAGLAHGVKQNPAVIAAYDEYAAPLVNEALGRVLPNEPLSLVDIADRIGILPPKRGRRALR